MAEKKYKIRMGNPCTFGWENMTVTEGGRHCAQCDKTVVDFTSMTDEELIKYLMTHKNICGHFNRSQLNRTIILHEPRKRTLLHWPSIAAMLVAGLFQLMPNHLQAQNPSAKLYHRSTSIIRTDQSTQPDQTRQEDQIKKDSLGTYTLRVVDASTKQPIKWASIQIEGQGNFRTDKKGNAIFNLNYLSLPESVKITVTASDYYATTVTVSLKSFNQKLFYQVELLYRYDGAVDGGELYIEQD